MTSKSEPSGAARHYRAAIRLLLLLAVALLVAAYAGARGRVPLPVGIACAVAFVGCLVLIGTLGLGLRRQLLLERDRATRVQIILIIAGQLAASTDEQLEGIASRGGPAGEAAELLIEGRREPKRKG
jgi:hypothetical protein